MNKANKSTLARLVLGLALGLAAPAIAATDGASGATSTGTFSVTAEVAAAPQVSVQILGLSDWNFGTIPADLATNLLAGGNFVCFNRSAAGNVILTVVQTGNSTSDFNVNDGAGGNSVRFGLTLSSPASGTIGLQNNASVTIPRSGEGCDENTNNSGVAHSLHPILFRPAGGFPAGASMSGQFTVTLAAE